jgi:thiamine-monophosphate kinase
MNMHDASASPETLLPAIHQAMGPGHEFDTIRALLDRWGPLASGIGDDAAVLLAPAGRTLVASTDAFVENAHFRDGWLRPDEVGARATAAALSDLAAMGARADAILVAFVVPDAWRTRLPAVADGIGRVVAASGARIAGGNISGGSTFSITTTVIGSAARVVPRSGARPGDVLLVTGLLGGPGRALRDWERGAEPPAWPRERFASPEPRLAAGVAFAEAGVHAMLDISDGLAADARHMAAASRVDLQLDASLVPCGPGVGVRDALSSGEEYELLVACPPEIVPALLAGVPERCGVRVTVVGQVLPASGAGIDTGAGASTVGERGGAVVVLGIDGTFARAGVPTGHDHFMV